MLPLVLSTVCHDAICSSGKWHTCTWKGLHDGRKWVIMLEHFMTQIWYKMNNQIIQQWYICALYKCSWHRPQTHKRPSCYFGGGREYWQDCFGYFPLRVATHFFFQQTRNECLFAELFKGTDIFIVIQAVPRLLQHIPICHVVPMKK